MMKYIRKHQYRYGSAASLLLFASAAMADDYSHLQFQDTATTECPTFKADGTGTPCAPDYEGPLTMKVLQGGDPPLTLRPDQGLGMGFTGSGSTTQGGKCAPSDGVASGCPIFGLPKSIPAGAGPGANPNMGNPPAAFTGGLTGLSAALTSQPSGGLPCGGALPTLSTILNFTNPNGNPSNISLGNILYLGLHIRIGMPPLNVPDLKLTIPKVTIPQLPKIDLPNMPKLPPLPRFSWPDLSGLAFIFSELESLIVKFPSLDFIPPPSGMPIVTFPKNFDFSLLPMQPYPIINFTLPDPNFPDPINPHLSISISLLNTLLATGELDIPDFHASIGFDTLHNFAGNIDCPGSVFSLPQNSIHLVMPPSTLSATATVSASGGNVAAMGSFSVQNQNITYPPAGSNNTLVMPDAAPIAFNLYTEGVIGLPQGGSFVGPKPSSLSVTIPQTGNTVTGSNIVDMPPVVPTAAAPHASDMLISLPIYAHGTQCDLLPILGTAHGNTLGATFTPNPANETDGQNGRVVIAHGMATNPKNSATVNVDQLDFTNTLPGTITNGKLDLGQYCVCMIGSDIVDGGMCNSSGFGIPLGVWLWNPQFIASIIHFNVTADKPNIPVAAAAVTIPTSTTLSNAASVVPPVGSYLHLPSGTPVGFSIDTAGSTIVLPAGGTFLNDRHQSVSVPQGGAIVALGNQQVVIGYAVTPKDSSGNSIPSIQLPGIAEPIAQDANGNLPSVITGITPNNIITYASTQFISISTTEVQVPPGTAVPANDPARADNCGAGSATINNCALLTAQSPATAPTTAAAR